jgi:hypothetical protein
MDGEGKGAFARVSLMKVASVVAGIVLSIILLAATAVGAGFLATIGARVAGMPVPQSGSFDLAPLVYFSVAGVAGAILFGPVAAGLYHFREKKRSSDPGSSMLVAAVAISLLAFPAGFACYKSTKMVERNRGEEVLLAAERQGALYDQIRNDPAVVLRERWFEEKYGRKVAYEHSLSDETITYDARTIGDLYAADKAHAWMLLSHRAIDEALLSRRFDVALEELTKRNNENEELFSILMNPKAKKEWFEAVAASDAVRNEKYPALNLLVADRLPAAGVPIGSIRRNARD